MITSPTLFTEESTDTGKHINSRPSARGIGKIFRQELLVQLLTPLQLSVF